MTLETAANETQTAAKKPYCKVGDIFVFSWGYEQTNIDFYEVVQAKEGSPTIVVRHRNSKIVRSSVPDDYVVPGEGFACFGPGNDKSTQDNQGAPMRKTVKSDFEGKPSIRIASYGHAWLWDGREMAETNSMYGR